MLAVLVVLAGLAAGTGTAAAAAPGFTVAGHQIQRGGQPWTPYGFSVWDFGNGPLSFAPGEAATVDAKIRADAGAWHGNTVRIQVEQDEFVYGGDGHTAADFRSRVFAAIGYAESLGLAVVINDTTEATDGIYTRNEPLPTAATLAFWKDMGRYRADPDIILDPFNEPRPPGGGANGNWPAWFHGGRGYIGAPALIRDLRAMGWHGQLWMETPGNFALAEMIATWPRYRLAGSDIVYSYHHTAVDQRADPTAAEWAAQFGNLVTRDGQPVVDGEWTNRSVPDGTQGGVFEPSGDTGQCWGHAPRYVPLYLADLARLGIGMIVWALGPLPDHPRSDPINADGGSFASANSYAGWHGCVTPRGGTTSGAGQLLKNWFAKQGGQLWMNLAKSTPRSVPPWPSWPRRRRRARRPRPSPGRTGLPLSTPAASATP